MITLYNRLRKKFVRRVKIMIPTLTPLTRRTNFFHNLVTTSFQKKDLSMVMYVVIATNTNYNFFMSVRKFPGI